MKIFILVLLQLVNFICLSQERQDYYHKIADIKLHEEEDYYGALHNFYKALEFSTDEVQTLNNIDWIKIVYRKMDRREKGIKIAIHILDSLIEINTNKSYLEKRAEYKMQIENYTEAIEDYQKSLEIAVKDEDHSSYYYSIGYCYFNLNQPFNAMDSFKKAIKIIKESSDSRLKEMQPLYNHFYYLGKCKTELGDFQGAMVDYKMAISICPKERSERAHSIYNCLAQAYFLSKNYTVAIETINEALVISKYNEYSLIIVDETLEECDKDRAYSYYLRGWAKYKINQKRAACSDWSKSGELGCKDAYSAIRAHCNQ